MFANVVRSDFALLSLHTVVAALSQECALTRYAQRGQYMLR
jgi:hypothetical protein